MIGMLSPLDGIFFCSRGAACASDSLDGRSIAAPMPMLVLMKSRRLRSITNLLLGPYYGPFLGRKRNVVHPSDSNDTFTAIPSRRRGLYTKQRDLSPWSPGSVRGRSPLDKASAGCRVR